MRPKVLRCFYALATLALLMLASCGNRIVRVYPLTKAPTGHLKESGFIYYLPLTVVHLEFQLISRYHIPGPYELFAGQFLGIQNDLDALAQSFEIRSVRISTSVEADRSQPFFVRLYGKPVPQFVELTRSGMIVPFSPELSPPYTLSSVCKTSRPSAYFLDLSTKPFIDAQQNIFYSVVRQDTAFVRVPVQRNMIVKRSLEEKAKQAADLIFSLRNKRVEIATGEVDVPAANGVIESMLTKIDQLESQYLELFIGRIHTDTSIVRISYIPRKGEETSIPCRFSEEKGVVNASDVSATPLVLHIKPEWTANDIPLIPTIKNAFYCRNACMAEISLSINGESIISGRYPITQFGEIQRLPIIPMSQ